MEAGEIIIKTKLVVDDFKKQLDKAKDIAKEKTSGISSVLSKLFEKVSPKIKEVFLKGFSVVANLGKTLLKTVKGILKTITSLGLSIGLSSVLVAGILGGAFLLAKALEKSEKEIEQFKADLEYIVFAIGKALEPTINSVAEAISKILSMIIKLIRYTALFINLWVGRNVFESATADAFAKSMEEAEKSSSKTAKNAKEIKKQLAGFDEMNVLSDNSGGGTTGSATPTPSFDFSDFSDIKTPKWMEDIVAFGKWVLANWKEVVFTLLMIKVFIDILTGNWVAVVIDLIGLLVIGFMLIWDEVKKIIDNLLIIWDELVRIFTDLWDGFVKWIGTAINDIGNFFSDLWNDIVTGVETTWDVVISILSIIGTWIYANVIKPTADFFVGLWNGIINGVKIAIQWIKDMFNGLVNFFSTIINKILGFFKTIGTNVGNVVGGAFKTVINGVLKAIEDILNFPIKAINKLIKTINDVPGINLKTLSTFKLPRLAKGGIVSMPGRGVPIGNAIVGERGQEAVLPLTDSQQMALLGEAIGRYININANIPIYVGNRQIAREMRKINAEDDFAYNR